jgi:pheromone a factor receptor
VPTAVRPFPLPWNTLTGSLSGLNMYRIWTRGRQVKSIISSSTGSPSYNHYIRLFMLSSIDMLFTIPFNIWWFTTYFQVPILPWPGWKYIHSDWSNILRLTTAELRANPHLLYQVEISRWICVFYGFIFFVFFGVTAEARKHYASPWQTVSKTFYRQKGFPRESSEYVLGFVLIS